MRSRGDPEQLGLRGAGLEPSYDSSRGVDDLLVGGLFRRPRKRMQAVVKEDQIKIGYGGRLLNQPVDLRIKPADEAAPVVRVHLTFERRQQMAAVATRNRVAIEE